MMKKLSRRLRHRFQCGIRVSTRDRSVARVERTGGEGREGRASLLERSPRPRRRRDVYATAGFAAFAYAPVALRADEAVRRLPVWLRPAAYFTALSLISSAFELPVSFVEGFALERRFGLSDQTRGGWLSDYAKSSVLSTALSGCLRCCSASRCAGRRGGGRSGRARASFHYFVDRQRYRAPLRPAALQRVRADNRIARSASPRARQTLRRRRCGDSPNGHRGVKLAKQMPFRNGDRPDAPDRARRYVDWRISGDGDRVRGRARTRTLRSTKTRGV